ncbi:uncharacterized protein [Nicotiana sylvestris]|uniref:uncharacterized protein n=1 Tax=Nicotiana sylvestris TaxID=4096 RepID=UPI00388CCD78
MAIDKNIQELLVIRYSNLLILQVVEEWAMKNSKILPYLYHVQELRRDKNLIDPIQVKIHDHPAYCDYVEEEADGKPWFHDIKEYLAKGEYPELANPTQKRTL